MKQCELLLSSLWFERIDDCSARIASILCPMSPAFPVTLSPPERPSPQGEDATVNSWKNADAFEGAVRMPLYCDRCSDPGVRYMNRRDRGPFANRRRPMNSIAMAACLLLWLASTAAAQTTVLADAFVNSVGVNVHLHYNDTLYYDNFPLVRSRLQELRVRHVRDGLIDTTWPGILRAAQQPRSGGHQGHVHHRSRCRTRTSVQAYPSRMSQCVRGLRSAQRTERQRRSGLG